MFCHLTFLLFCTFVHAIAIWSNLFSLSHISLHLLHKTARLRITIIRIQCTRAIFFDISIFRWGIRCFTITMVKSVLWWFQFLTIAYFNRRQRFVYFTIHLRITMQPHKHSNIQCQRPETNFTLIIHSFFDVLHFTFPHKTEYVYTKSIGIIILFRLQKLWISTKSYYRFLLLDFY